MATYFVASGGSNTAPYETWAKAATSLQTALTAANAEGDIVVIQYNAVPTGDAELAADTTYSFGNHVSLISASNDGGSAYTPTVMGTANWIGNSTTFRSVTLAATNFRCYVYGVTLRVSGATTDNINFAAGDGCHFVEEDCYYWLGSTASGSAISAYIQDQNLYAKLINPTFRFGAVAQVLRISAKVEIEGGSVSSAGTIPTGGLIQFGQTDPGGGYLSWEGGDLSAMGSNALVGNSVLLASTAVFTRCKLGTGFTVLATQTNTNKSSVEAFLFDCAVGDTHGFFGYYDAMGSVVSDTGIYYTTGAAGQSWKIVTTENCNYHAPFQTPTIDLYHTGTSSITPYLEILRDGSAAAFQNDEVWGEFSAKTTSGFVTSTRYTDAKALTAAAADQADGAGLGSWTGEAGTAWSGKVDSGSAFTPAEAGHIRARVSVGEPSITVYVDPQIRT